MTGESDLWKTKEPDPKLVARQLATLREWLAHPMWTSRQAACLFAGVLPPELLYDDRPFGGYLPPKAEWQHAKEIEQEIFAVRIAHLEEILGEALPRNKRTPENYISLGLELGIVPEWMEFARRDEATRKFLPLAALTETNHREPLSWREVASLGGKAKKASDPKRIRFFAYVTERHEAGTKTAEIIRQLTEDFGDEPDENLPTSATIYRWVGEIKKARS